MQIRYEYTQLICSHSCTDVIAILFYKKSEANTYCECHVGMSIQLILAAILVFTVPGRTQCRKYG